MSEPEWIAEASVPVFGVHHVVKNPITALAVLEREASCYQVRFIHQGYVPTFVGWEQMLGWHASGAPHGRHGISPEIDIEASTLGMLIDEFAPIVERRRRAVTMEPRAPRSASGEELFYP
jgi:hypothetical protein